MIYIVTTAKHAYTHTCLVDERESVSVESRSYSDLSSGSIDPRGTCILTDFDRLTPVQSLEAAQFSRQHRKRGGLVLNDPARVLSRYGLLRILKRKKINQFNAYRVEECVTPKQWPVFLRVEGSHSPPLSGLLGNQQEVADAVQKAVNVGFPLSAMLIVEYAAEPVRPGLFRKFSIFRIGERLIGYTCVHDDQWIVKQGKPGIAPQELYEDEFRCVRDNPYADAVWPAFRLAGIDYGRADFGIVGGRVQIYEINTNPELRLRPPPSPVARRNESYELFRRNYLAAMNEIDSR